MRLISPKAATKKITDFLRTYFDFPDAACRYSCRARLSTSTLCVKSDVVLLQTDDGSVAAGEVWFHAEAEMELLSLVPVWEKIEMNADTGAALWRKSDNPRLMCLEDIIEPLIYTMCRPGVVRTLIPIQYRRNV